MRHYSKVRSKNHSCDDLRSKNNGLGPFTERSVVRLGSTTMTELIYPKSSKKGLPIIEINTVESIRNSRSKLLMKGCFKEANVPQSEWTTSMNTIKEFTDNVGFPIVVKRVFGFKGRGMSRIPNQRKLDKWFNENPNTQGFYAEKLYSSKQKFNKEYRLHCTQDECFMSWRKLRKRDAQVRWYFNSDNCNWVSEEHELFDRPVNWDNIVKDCCNAIKSVGLDIGCCDLRIQSSKDGEGNIIENPKYIIVEVNSAPALAEHGIEAYRKQITKLISNKIRDLNLISQKLILKKV